jgi:four helix bundle protein
MFNFERLDVWQKAVAFCGTIYEVTRTFPIDEKFGLVNQIRRAAVSVSSNIAEGAGRSPADFSKFLSYAAGSLYEVVTQSTVARNQGYLTEEAYSELYQEAEEVARMLTGLRKSLGN